MQTITITVYENRHMRASQVDLNDMRGGRYISQKAIRALQRVGIKFRFLKLIKTLVDVTDEYQQRVAKPAFAKRECRRLKESDSFDPFERRA